MYKLLLPLLILPALLVGKIEETLTIIKPNAVSNKYVGDIIKRYENEDFTIKNLRMTKLTKKQAEQFYAEHKEKPFFEDLTTYMSTGSVVAIELKGNNAITRNRALIGATDPRDAEPNTLRALYGQSKTRNSLHGSDSAESARRELNFFFNQSVSANSFGDTL